LGKIREAIKGTKFAWGTQMLNLTGKKLSN